MAFVQSSVLLSSRLIKAVTALAQELVLLTVLDAQFSWGRRRCQMAPFWRRGCALPARGPFSPSVWCHSARAACSRHVPPNAEGRLAGRKMKLEELWREFFSDPSEWLDHRSDKANPYHPDFKHKKAQKSLWLDNNLTPSWVETELTAMAPGSLQSDIFSWNIRLRRYANAGDYEKTMELFQQLQRESFNPNKYTFVPVLNACSYLGALDEGKRAHEQIIERGYESDVYVASSLIDMYAKCGSINDAFKVFSRMRRRHVVTWNAMILGYVKCGKGQKALELYRWMQREGVDPDPFTFVGLLNACASLTALGEGKRTHEQIIDKRCECDAYVANSLVDMYAKCGSIEDARKVFNKMSKRDVVSWNALIQGYVKCGQGHKAVELYWLMKQEQVNLDAFTFVGVLNACASIGLLEEGRRAHEHLIVRGFEWDSYVSNALIDMYTKCGSIGDARRVFNKITKRDVVSWSALILGYVKCGQGREALDLSKQMQREGVDLNPITFVGVLNACASIGALGEGRLAHGQIVDRGYECDIYVANSLIDMYAKCESMEDACRIFKKMPRRDVVSWSAMLAGYSKRGYAKEVLEYFKKMCEEVEVNAVSFSSLLSACSHGGLVDEGKHYFESITEVFSISPTLEHYACLVDLLGRAGRLHEAEVLIRKMPCKPNAPVWMSLLAACRIHGNVEMGECAAKRLVELDPQSTASYVLLSNMYSAAGRLDRAQAVYPHLLEGM